MYKPIFIFVEGADDVRFFETFIKPLLDKFYTNITITAYKSLTSRELVNLVKGAKQTIRNNSGDYWLIHDKDDKPCITRVKDYLVNDQNIHVLERERIIVAIHEIESWYIGGNKTITDKYHLAQAHDFTKEEFNKIAEKENMDHGEFILHIINNPFSLNRAKSMNDSLAYFINKCGV